MKVYELIEKLKKVDPNCEVCISVDGRDDWGSREADRIEVGKYPHEDCVWIEEEGTMYGVSSFIIL